MSTPVRRAIYGQLTSAGSTLRSLLGTPSGNYTWSIYHDQAPADAGFPFIVFGKSSGVPTEAFHDPSAFETDVWLIKGVVRGDDVLINDDLGQSESASDRADRIADLIKAQLNDATLSISGAVCLYLRRQSDVEYPELTDGVIYRHSGALYRLITTNP